MLKNKKLLLSLTVLMSIFLLSSAVVMAQDSFIYWSMWEKGEPQQQVIEQAIKDFEEQYDVTVNVNWTGRDVVTALKPRLLAGENIDMTDQSGEELYGGLVANDVAGTMNDVLEMKVPNEDATVEDVLINESYGAYVREDGSLYIIPYNFITSAFWYDKGLFNDLGIEVPTTWDEFLQMAEMLKENNLDPVAYGIQTDVYRGYFPYQTAERILGKNALNNAASDPTGELFEDPRWERVGDILYQFSKEGKNLLMQGYESSVYPAPQMDWIMGRAGTFYCGTWIPVETKNAAGENFEYGAFKYPTFEDGDGDPTAVETYPIGFNVLKDSENSDLAKKFVAFFLQEKYAEQWVADTKNMTPRAGIAAPAELKDAKALLDNANSTFRLNDGIQADYPEWYANVFLPLASDILLGEIDGAEWAEEMRAETVKFWKNRE
ncbi:MAG: extracellular solute-binding protein [Halanaerobiales bacterium]|nr:extracellular solute-binding protein [Halanaerobiales bacterium]